MKEVNALLEDSWHIFQRYQHPGMGAEIIVLKRDGSTKSVAIPSRRRGLAA